VESIGDQHLIQLSYAAQPAMLFVAQASPVGFGPCKD
jgi:hypothetical protein